MALSDTTEDTLDSNDRVEALKEAADEKLGAAKSAYNAANSAIAELTGKELGATSAMMSYKESSEKKKNVKINELTKDLSTTVKSYGEKLKGKFNYGGVLSKLNSALDKLGNIPFGDKLKALAKNFLSSQLSKFKKLAEESAAAAWRAAKAMAKSIVDKVLNMVLTRIYLPDVVYLMTIQGLYKVGSNLEYNDNYARKKALAADYVLSVAWIDETIGLSYSLIGNPSRTTSEINKAARGSCVKIFDYMLEYLLFENKTVLRNIRSYAYDIKLLENDIKTHESVITALENEHSKKITTQTRREEIEVLIEVEKNTIKEIKTKIKAVEKEKKVWDDLDYQYRTTLASSFKNLIVNSVGNLTKDLLAEYIYKYNVKPAWFGDYDPDFNGRYKFNSSDVNYMAPFYNESGFIQDVQQKLGDTRLVKTSKLPKYIVLRNIFLKYIYVLMNSTNIYGRGNQLSSQVLYERLCYNTMDFLSQQVDKFLGTMIEDGLGKFAIDTLNAIERAIYDYTVLVEKSFNDPLGTDYMQLMSYGQQIPAPLVPNSTQSSVNQPDDITSTKKLTNEEMEKALKYYFRYTKSSNHPVLMKSLFTDLKNKYASENNETLKSFWYLFTNYYFGNKSVTDLDIDNIDTYSSGYIMLVYTNCLYEMYTGDYKDNVGSLSDYTEIDKEIKKLFEKHFKALKDQFYHDIVSDLTDGQIYQYHILIYNILGEYGVKNVKYSLFLFTFLRKHYTQEAYTPPFYIEKYLDSLSSEEKKNKLVKVLQDLDTSLVENPEIYKVIKKETIDKILIAILPEFGYIIDIDKAKDFDINDPSIKDQIEEDYRNNLLLGSFQVWIKDFDIEPLDPDGDGVYELDIDKIYNVVNADNNRIIFYNAEIDKGL